VVVSGGSYEGFDLAIKERKACQRKNQKKLAPESETIPARRSWDEQTSVDNFCFDKSVIFLRAQTQEIAIEVFVAFR
jgi:hypothetical protein